MSFILLLSSNPLKFIPLSHHHYNYLFYFLIFNFTIFGKYIVSSFTN